MHSGSSTQPAIVQHTNITPPNAISISLTIALPIVMIGAIVGYKKHKARMLQRHIHRLNRVWQLDASKTIP